jgi:CheY-like chemotaxis protein
MNIPGNLSDSAVEPSLGGRRILIVEDELLVALDTKAFVNRFGGLVVGPCARVLAALETIRTQPVDGAILDINVAGTPSFVVADALQDRRIPFVFCTGYGRDIVPQRHRNAPLVEKPIDPTALMAAVLAAFGAQPAEPAR